MVRCLDGACLAQSSGFALRLEQDQYIVFANRALHVADNGAVLVIVKKLDAHLRNGTTRTCASKDLLHLSVRQLILGTMAHTMRTCMRVTGARILDENGDAYARSITDPCRRHARSVSRMHAKDG